MLWRRACRNCDNSGHNSAGCLSAGPVVRASLVRVKDALSKANITTVEGMEKKKTIAQILDEALEQEFPEEKVEHIGKDYNETAKQEDVSFQSVLLFAWGF